MIQTLEMLNDAIIDKMWKTLFFFTTNNNNFLIKITSIFGK